MVLAQSPCPGNTFSWTTSPLSKGDSVRVQHLNELRNAINTIRTTRLDNTTYTIDTAVAGQKVLAPTLEQIYNAVTTATQVAVLTWNENYVGRVGIGILRNQINELRNNINALAVACPCNCQSYCACVGACGCNGACSCNGPCSCHCNDNNQCCGGCVPN